MDSGFNNLYKSSFKMPTAEEYSPSRKQTISNHDFKACGGKHQTGYVLCGQLIQSGGLRGVRVEA